LIWRTVKKGFLKYKGWNTVRHLRIEHRIDDWMVVVASDFVGFEAWLGELCHLSRLGKEALDWGLKLRCAYIYLLSIAEFSLQVRKAVASTS
jgi:hypothetical protein